MEDFQNVCSNVFLFIWTADSHCVRALCNKLHNRCACTSWKFWIFKFIFCQLLVSLVNEKINIYLRSINHNSFEYICWDFITKLILFYLLIIKGKSTNVSCIDSLVKVFVRQTFWNRKNMSQNWSHLTIFFGNSCLYQFLQIDFTHFLYSSSLLSNNSKINLVNYFEKTLK